MDFKQLARDLDNWTTLPRDLDAAQSKVKCKLTHGLAVRWYYQDDKKFYEEEKMNPREETVYHGIVLTKPNVEPRGELSLCDCVVVIDSYPCEKENARAEYCALGRLLDSDELVELFAAYSVEKSTEKV